MNGDARYRHAYDCCLAHAGRLRWAAGRLLPYLPFDAATLTTLDAVDVAVVDQLLTRFGQLQDAMGGRLFPAVLELTKEQGGLSAFIDKLNRLEKIGALVSAAGWLELREVRNSLVHDYPEDPQLQAATVNRVAELVDTLLTTLDAVDRFARCYLPQEESMDLENRGTKGDHDDR
ncbi:MAG: hypothetical protein Q9M13_03250 [Mariprofundales bacterium]|nr:hypothetical protein [Mariprofundales bacterium]